MKTAQRQAKESEIVKDFMQLPHKDQRKILSFMQWIKDNRPTDDERKAELERRIAEYDPDAE